MKWASVLTVMLLGLSAVPVTAAPKHDGYFSRNALDMWRPVAGSDRSVTFTSPDGTWTVTAGNGDSETAYFRVRGRLGHLDLSLADFVDAEMVFAPDSSGAFFTGSDGGAVGTYNLHVIRKHDGHLKETDLSPLVRKAFGHPVVCYDPEDANVGGIRWLGPNRILVAAEIPPHTNCDSMGTFRAYVIDLDHMKVVRSYNQLTAKRMFMRSLGRELRAADDSCIRRPVSCQIPALHGRNPAP